MPSGLGSHSNADAGIAAPGTRVIIAAMTAAGVRRIVVYGHNLRRGLPIPRADVAASCSPSSTSPRSSGQVIAVAS